MIIITNDTFGTGPRFTIREVASIEGKTLRGRYYTARVSNTTFCVATKALAREAIAINDAMDRIEKRARKLREKIKAKGKK